MARLIEPSIARPFARRLGGTPRPSAAEIAALEDRLDLAVRRSEDLVATISGIPAPAPVRWGVVDRVTWVEANIDGMNQILEPLMARLGARMDSLPRPVRLAQKTALSVEVGMLLGYVSRRVLGQYDLLVPDGVPLGRAARKRGGAALYFVGPNMIELGQRFRFDPDDFALWVAVHEVTHRFQFAGVPWLRDHFFGLVSEYISSLDLDARRLAKRFGTAVRRAAARGSSEERHPIYLLSSDEQRTHLDRIQALMAVVEGHGNYVMDAVGTDHIPTVVRMREVFDRRRDNVGRLQRILHQALGLEMKLRQYELGQQFCDRVVEIGGPGALSALWESPERLPTLSELNEPQRWLSRIAA